MMRRIDAAERFSRVVPETVREPTGSPLSMCSRITAFSTAAARGSSSGFGLSSDPLVTVVPQR